MKTKFSLIVFFCVILFTSCSDVLNNKKSITPVSPAASTTNGISELDTLAPATANEIIDIDTTQTEESIYDKRLEALDTLYNEPISINMESYIKIDKNTSTNINVIYPRISGHKDSKIQTEINALLKDNTFCYPYDYIKDCEGTTYELNTDYFILSNNLISAQCKLRYYYEKDRHPHWIFMPITIDIKTGKVLELSDLIVIDDKIINMIKDGLLIGSNGSELLDVEMNGLIANITKNNFTDFYLTETSLGLKIDVPHLAGDYLTFEASIDELTDILKTEYFSTLY